jgi:hypothetical protein
MHDKNLTWHQIKSGKVEYHHTCRMAGSSSPHEEQQKQHRLKSVAVRPSPHEERQEQHRRKSVGHHHRIKSVLNITACRAAKNITAAKPNTSHIEDGEKMTS